MKLILIEDEIPALKRLEKLLQELAPESEVIGTADSIRSALTLFAAKGTQADLALMDIELADGQSFEIFKHIEVRCPVIFTTAYDHFALQAFKVNSIDYLLKPLDPEELKRALDKFLRFQPRDDFRERIASLIGELAAEKKAFKSRFLVKSGTRLHAVSVADIAYFQSKDKLVWLHTHDKKRYVVDQSLDELAGMVDPKTFFQLNRQYLAQLSAVADIHTYFNGKLKLTLDPAVDEEVVVSREKAAEFRKWLDG